MQINDPIGTLFPPNLMWPPLHPEIVSLIEFCGGFLRLVLIAKDGMAKKRKIAYQIFLLFWHHLSPCEISSGVKSTPLKFIG